MNRTIWILATLSLVLGACDESRTPVGSDGGGGSPDAWVGDLGVQLDIKAGDDGGFTNDIWDNDMAGDPDSRIEDMRGDIMPPDQQVPDALGPDIMLPDLVPPDACAPNTFYLDSDGDGYGDTKKTVLACTPPKGYAKQGGDCDDSNKEIYPGALEKCNKKDDNCNYFIDEGLTKNVYYKDNDGDGFGSTSTVQDCMPPTGFVTLTGDCNDNNAAINPGATEACNEVDDNCNGFKDEGLTKKVYFKDVDGDGYGGPAWLQACSQPTGYVENAGDCNDYNKQIHPKAVEQCNTVDDDCNGIIDDNLKLITIYKDNDGDGFAAKNALNQQNCKVLVGWTIPVDQNGDGVYDWDCDDSDVTVYPGAPTKCGDGKDNNCDGSTDQLCFTTCPGAWTTGPYKMLYAYGNIAAPTVDLNGDGQHEIIVQDTFGFAILDPKGKPHYAWSKQKYNYSRRIGVVADIDDTATFGVATQTLEVLTGNGSVPRFYKLAGTQVTEYVGKDSVYDASSFMVRDMNNDGVPEFITSSWCNKAAGTRIFRFNKSNKAINLVRDIADPDGVCEYWDGRILTDLDGNGSVELVFGNGYPQAYSPQVWGGKIYARRFTNWSSLTNVAHCTNCFGTAYSSFYPGGTTSLFRVGDEIRAQVLYFSSNTPNFNNPGHYRYWTYTTAGVAKVMGSTNSATLWSGTTDVDRDGKPDNYGSSVAWLGLYDVNGDGYPDSITRSGQELRLHLWDNKQKTFSENVGSRLKIASSNINVRSMWDIDADGRLEVISADANGSVYCHELGKATWNKADSLPPHFTLFNRSYQWDNHEPNEGTDTNNDGLPDGYIQVPSALTSKGDFYSYLSSAADQDYYLVDAAWGASICLTSPKGRAYNLRVYSFMDRWNNVSKAITPDGKPDGFIWQNTSTSGGTVCFRGNYVMPPRYGEYKFIIGVDSAGATNYSPHWPYWITIKK